MYSVERQFNEYCCRQLHSLHNNEDYVPQYHMFSDSCATLSWPLKSMSDSTMALAIEAFSDNESLKQSSHAYEPYSFE